MSKVLCCSVFYRYVSHSFIILSLIIFIIEHTIENLVWVVNHFLQVKVDRGKMDKERKDVTDEKIRG